MIGPPGSFGPVPPPAARAEDAARGDDPDVLRPLTPTGRLTTPDGVGLAYYDLGGQGPPLLLAHATGFCGPVLAPLARSLSDRFRCVAFDERAHGASDPPLDGRFDWEGFATDVLTVVDGLELEHLRGFGHSAGGAALLLAEERRPGTFASLYCFEPVVYPSDPPLAPAFEGNPLAAGALRRRERFGSRGEAVANFSSKAPFDRLRPDVLAAYVDNGFAPGPHGIELRCRREHEAQIYAHGMSHDVWANLPAVDCPVTLACGSDTDAIGAGVLSRLAGRLRSPRPASPVVFDGLGHFAPLEDPDTVAASVGRWLDLEP